MRLTCHDPDCDAPAEVSEHTDLGSTHGPVLHVRVSCVDGHGFFMPWEKLDITADLAY